MAPIPEGSPMWLLGCTGEFGCKCPQIRTPYARRLANLAGHGTPSKYAKGCRCIVCRRGNAKRIREYREREKKSDGTA